MCFPWPISPWQQTRTTKYGKNYILWVLKVDGRYVTSTDKDDLIDKVYDQLRNAAAKNDPSLQTLEEIYPAAMVYVRDNTNKSDKTLQEYAGIWNRFFAETALIQKRICDISAAEWQDYYGQTLIGTIKQL